MKASWLRFALIALAMTVWPVAGAGLAASPSPQAPADCIHASSMTEAGRAAAGETDDRKGCADQPCPMTAACAQLCAGALLIPSFSLALTALSSERAAPDQAEPAALSIAPPKPPPRVA